MRGTVLSRWNWLDEIAIPVIAALMYVAWLAPLLRVVLGSPITHPRGLVYPWWAIVGVLLTAGWLARALGSRGAARPVLAIGGALAALGAVSLAEGRPSLAAVWQGLLAALDFAEGLPAHLIILLTTVGLWYGGSRGGWRQHKQLMNSFVAGILALGLLTLASPGLVGGEDVVAFLLTGLLALALVTVASHLAYQTERGLARPPLNRYWLMALGLAMLGIIVVGWVLSLFLAPETVAVLLGRLRPLLAYVGEAVAFVGMGIVWLLFLGYQFVSGLFQRSATPPPPQESRLPPSYTQQLPDLDITPGHPPSLPEGLGAVLLALALGTLVFVVLVSAWRRRSQPRRTSTALEEREFILSKELLLERWRGLFRAPARRRPALFADTLDLGRPRDRIRQAYRLLLLNAREQGLPRAKGQTVSAYRDVVAAAVPEAEQPVTILGRAYLLARYGDVEPPESLAREAQQASEAAQSALLRPRRVGR